MGTICSIDSRATSNPDAGFASPDEVVENIALTAGQKIATLDRWAFTVRSRVDAMSEGMTTQPEGAYTRDVELLRQIEKCLQKLREATK